MIEVNVTKVQINFIQFLDRVEQGEEVVITCQGKLIAVLSAYRKQFKRFVSYADLRSTQKRAEISSLEHLQAMRQETPY